MGCRGGAGEVGGCFLSWTRVSSEARPCAYVPRLLWGEKRQTCFRPDQPGAGLSAPVSFLRAILMTLSEML